MNSRLSIRLVTADSFECIGRQTGNGHKWINAYIYQPTPR